jgi:hypothetical protein
MKTVFELHSLYSDLENFVKKMDDYAILTLPETPNDIKRAKINGYT